MRQFQQDIRVIGFALFSMFFGAGNVIFPPYLGLNCGAQWFSGFLCYYLADIGLALLALFAVMRHGGSEQITNRLGHIPSTVLMSVIVLCIGPMLAIPRTAATTYELAVTPLLSDVPAGWFSFLFFAVILLLCLKESSVVDIVGKILTPVLFLGLLLLIGKGIITPIGLVPDYVPAENVPATGIEAGYQTMDVLAALVFGIIILNSIREKGHTTTTSQFRIAAGAGIIAALMLAAVYLGLTYLGASASPFFDSSVSRTALVAFLVQNLMGTPGILLFSVVVALACVTTAAALVSSAAAYFAALFHHRSLYQTLVFVICISSAAVSVIGLEQLVALASPILHIVYPPALTLVILSFFSRRIKHDFVFRAAALGAFFTSVLAALADLGLPLHFLKHLPLYAIGLGWLLPTALCTLAGILLDRIRSS